MRNSIYLFYIVFTCIVIQSCDRELENALNKAGSNRFELEKVLDYFEDNPDPLKY